ncbi:GNAT family protein [Exiguobacterium sp. 17-1]|uniref:GNAT family N-acetyltransferase n=1 Tax=Exiguobacterium sp. 17-1 TaxID=2931981 RepID=UPI001FFF3259|nr:GNAT family protein [Exiguobacterium sp. 17-1]MCK2157472.1 GNAT family N-acetyltransferase [Exiguobacterium sp. 17-1]
MMDLTAKPTLIGEKVILRPFAMEDIPWIERCLLDPEVLTLTGSSSGIDRKTLQTWYATRNEQSDRLDLAVIDQESGVLVGEVVVNDYKQQQQSMNFRILIGADGRNRGLGTEATRLLMDYLFRHTALDQLTLSVLAINPRARHVYEKIGFEVTGVDARDVEVEGKWIDSIQMVLTRKKALKL